MFVVYFLQKPFMTNCVVFKSESETEAKQFMANNENNYNEKLFMASLTEEELNMFQPTEEDFDDMYRAYCM